MSRSVDVYAWVLPSYPQGLGAPTSRVLCRGGLSCLWCFARSSIRALHLSWRNVVSCLEFFVCRGVVSCLNMFVRAWVSPSLPTRKGDYFRYFLVACSMPSWRDLMPSWQKKEIPHGPRGTTPSWRRIQCSHSKGKREIPHESPEYDVFMTKDPSVAVLLASHTPVQDTPSDHLYVTNSFLPRNTGLITCWNAQVAGNIKCIGCRVNNSARWLIYIYEPYRAGGSNSNS